MGVRGRKRKMRRTFSIRQRGPVVVVPSVRGDLMAGVVRGLETLLIVGSVDALV